MEVDYKALKPRLHLWMNSFGGLKSTTCKTLTQNRLTVLGTTTWSIPLVSQVVGKWGGNLRNPGDIGNLYIYIYIYIYMERKRETERERERERGRGGYSSGIFLRSCQMHRIP